MRRPSFRLTKSAASFKPWLDMLEDRVQPSIVPGTVMIEPLIPIDPTTGTGSNSVVSVSSQQLDVTRGGTASSFTVVLNSQPSAEVDITLAVYDPNAATDGTTLALDQPHLAFTTSDWNTPQTVNLTSPAGSTPLSDAFVEVDGTTDSSDPNFDAQAVPPISVDVSDPVTPSAGLVVSSQALTVTAGGPSVSYTITLATQPTADVTVSISQFSAIVDPPVAVVGSDGGVSSADGSSDSPTLNISPATLTFTADNWDQPQTVTVSAPAGQVGAYGSNVFLNETVTSADPNYNNVFAPTVAVQVQNNPAYSLVFSTNSMVQAPGVTGSYTVALASQPTANVTVTINAVSEGVAMPMALPADDTSSGGSGSSTLTLTPTTLTFTPQDWNVPQTVTVTSTASADGTGYFELDQLQHTVTSTDPNWNNVAVPPVTVVVTNDTVPPGGPIPVSVPVFVGPVTVVETGTGGSLTPILTEAPGGGKTKTPPKTGTHTTGTHTTGTHSGTTGSSHKHAKPAKPVLPGRFEI